MAIDLVLRGGTVIDGSGEARFTADVAIEDGRVVEIGRIAARGHREIDASETRTSASKVASGR